MELVNCIICGSTEQTHLYELHDLLLDQKDSLATFVKCKQCNLIYQNPQPTINELEYHYPPEYEPFQFEPLMLNTSFINRQAIEYGLNKRSKYITRYHKTGKLLDVGCSTGVFLQTIYRLNDWEVFGVEINSYAANIARRKFGENIHIGTLESANYPDESFEVITLWDVLEHINDPKSTVQEIYRILKDDGILVLRVPNGYSRDANLFGKYWIGLDAPRHLFVFEPITLRELLDLASLRIVAMDSKQGGYPTFVLSLRTWMTGNNVNEITRDRILKILNHPLFRLVTGPFFYLAGFGNNGPLLTVVAKKYFLG